MESFVFGRLFVSFEPRKKINITIFAILNMHIKTVCRKIRAAISSMKFLISAVELCLYTFSSLEYCCMEYCCLVWVFSVVGAALASSFEPLVDS